MSFKIFVLNKQFQDKPKPYTIQTITTMAINLIDVLRNSFDEKAYQDISEHTGINLESTKNGLNVIIPAVLACILGNNTTTNASQPKWWNTLKDDYPDTKNDFIETKNINSSSFFVKGREILSSMFRTNHDELVKSVSSVAGIQKEKAAGLIEVGVPLIIGYINNWMKRKDWRFKDLIKNLIEIKPSIVDELPIGISPAHFGINNLPKNNFSEIVKTEIPRHKKTVKRNRNALMWIIGLLVLFILSWYFLGVRT